MEKELLAHLLNNRQIVVFNLYDANFYVMNSERNVYKCLDNNNNDSGSTVEPTGTDTIVLSTADGYKWKYMYTLSLLNNQISYQLTLWQFLQIVQYHQMLLVRLML